MNNFIQLENFNKILPYIRVFEHGVCVTVLLALFTVLIGFILGTILVMMRISDVRPFAFLKSDKNGCPRSSGCLYRLSNFNPISFLAASYVEIIRSTPVLVQVMIIYYGVFSVINLPNFTLFGFINFRRFFPGVIALGLNSGAYLCEIIRSGVQSIDIGQSEAARALGLNQTQNLRYIIFPQALKNVLPAIANEFVAIIKESAVTYIIGIQDIMAAVQTIKGATFIIMEPLIVATTIYFCLCFPTSKIIAHFEKRMNHGDKR